MTFPSTTVDSSSRQSVALSGETYARQDRRQSKRLLFLQNPGRVSRHWMQGLINAAQALGLEHVVCELGPMLQAQQMLGEQLARPLVALLQRERIGAVVSYTCNGVNDLPMIQTRGGVASIFAALGIPHLMFWWDHPHWAHDKIALQPQFQPHLQSPLCHHFLKADAAAAELRRLLGWTNCHTLLPAVDPQMIVPAPNHAPDFDVVAIVGHPPAPDPRLDRFLGEDDPDVDAITKVCSAGVQWRIAAAWTSRAPTQARPSLEAFAHVWADRKIAHPDVPSWRHFEELKPEFPDASRWVAENPALYLAGAEALWCVNGWRRTFVIRHLARRCRVGVFGADWSGADVPSEPSWVEYEQMAQVFARGRIALSVAQGHDEEGVILKPFEIVASGVPAVVNHTVALERAFVGDEIQMFRTPGECWRMVRGLLDDPPRARRMAEAARQRLDAEHLWRHRLQDALSHAGLVGEEFRGGAAAAAAGRLAVSLSFDVRWSAPA